MHRQRKNMFKKKKIYVTKKTSYFFKYNFSLKGNSGLSNLFFKIDINLW